MIEIVREPSRLAGLAEAWNELARPFASPLLGHEWQLACAQAFAPDVEPAVVTLSRAGALVAAAPLARAREGGADSLQWLGEGPLGETCGPIYRDLDSLAELLDAVVELGRPLRLSRVPASGPVGDLLRRACGGRALFACRRVAGSPYLAIDGDWPACERRLSPRRRESLRRADRRCRALGPTTTELLEPTPETLGPLFEELLRVEASGWKGRLGSALAHDEPLRRFFWHYSSMAARAGSLRLAVLRASGRLAAFQLAVEHAARLWILKIGYEEALARCSPGSLLTHFTIRAAFARGLEGYEFLGAEEKWIRAWTAASHPRVSLRAYPLALNGFLSLGLHLSRRVLGRSDRPRRGRGLS